MNSQPLSPNGTPSTAKAAVLPHVDIPDHELVRPIGEGSYGQVWLVRNVVGTWRAAKIVYRCQFEEERPYEREFEGIRNFEPLSRTHEGLIDVLQIGRNDAAGYFYYIMELADDVRGGQCIEPEQYQPRTLREELRQRGRLPFAQCLEIGLTLSASLAHLHQHGLVHRDVKPGNVIFVGGVAKLADIGLVTVQGKPKTFVGTEGYIAPEGPGTAQADLYSLGIVLYEISVGKSRRNYPEPLTHLLDLPDGRMVSELNEVVLRACEEDPKRRYRTAAELHAELAFLQGGHSLHRLRAAEKKLRKIYRVGLPLAATVLVGIASYSFYQQFRRQELEKELAINRVKLQASQRELGLTRQVSEAMDKLVWQRVEELFEADKPAFALAQLSALLRRNPSNEVAAVRLMSALTHRNFALPATQALQHGDEVYWAEFSHDGRRVVTASVDKTARIWDARTGLPLTPPLKHDDRVMSAHFSADGARMVTASRDHTAQVWDALTGQPTSPPLHHDDWVNSAQFSPDSSRVVTASNDHTARVWDAATGKLRLTLRHQDAVVAAEFSPDGRRVVTASWDGTAQVWDAITGQAVGRRLKHADKVVSAEFSPDGQRVVTASDDVTARVWDAQTGEPITPPLQHFGQVRTAQFSPDCQRVVTASWDFTARVWNAATGQPLTEPLRHEDRVRWATFSPEGLRVLTASSDFTARIWDARTGQPLTQPLRHNHQLRSAEFSHDGQWVVTASQDKTARIWDVRFGAALAQPLSAGDSVRNPQFSLDGKRVILISGPTRQQACVWSVFPRRPLTALLTHSGPITSMQFSPDRRRVVTAAGDGTARVWSAEDGQPVTPPLRHQDAVVYAEFSPDGQFVATASSDRTARIWDATTGKPITGPLPHDDRVERVEFSPDGHSVVTVSWDATARVWDARTGQLLCKPLRHEERVNAARFSPDGRSIVTASRDDTARVWDAHTGAPFTPSLNHAVDVLFARFSPDGQRIVTVAADRTVRVWEVRRGILLCEPLKHSQKVYSAEFDALGQRVVTVSYNEENGLWDYVPSQLQMKVSPDQGVRVWDVAASQPLTEWLRFDAHAESAEFSADGRRVVAATFDPIGSAWEVPVVSPPVPVWLPALAEAVVGLKLNEQGTSEPVPIENLAQIKAQVLAETSANPIVGWARWFLADRSSRPIAPGSSVTFPAYVQSFVEKAAMGPDAERLEKAVLLSPTNADVLAGLARRLLDGTDRSNTGRVEEAVSCIRRAREYAPEQAIVWWAQVELWTRQGKFQEGLAELERLIPAYPQNPVFILCKGLLLEEAGRFKEALSAHSAAIDLAAKVRHPALYSFLLARSRLLEQMGRRAEAAADKQRAEQLRLAGQ